MLVVKITFLLTLNLMISSLFSSAVFASEISCGGAVQNSKPSVSTVLKEYLRVEFIAMPIEPENIFKVIEPDFIYSHFVHGSEFTNSIVPLSSFELESSALPTDKIMIVFPVEILDTVHFILQPAAPKTTGPLLIPDGARRKFFNSDEFSIQDFQKLIKREAEIIEQMIEANETPFKIELRSPLAVSDIAGILVPNDLSMDEVVTKRDIEKIKFTLLRHRDTARFHLDKAFPVLMPENVPVVIVAAEDSWAQNLKYFKKP
jgi:hypothetical protein